MRNTMPTSAQRLYTKRRSTVLRSISKDITAISVLVILVFLVMAHLWYHDNWLAELDIFTFFLPWYGHLGERLRDFDVPGWTPYLASGAPFAGDPTSGWMYFPAMAVFALFEVTAAFKVMILVQLLIGGVATHLLGRVLGLNPVAALTSAVAFTFGPFVYGQTDYVTTGGHVATWVPVAILAAELALRTERPVYIASWWALGGLAVSQMAAAWMGLGLLNGLMMVFGWIGYRVLLPPPCDDVSIRTRLVKAACTGAIFVIGGTALGAAGVLPRLAVNAQSNIPGGDYSDVLGGDYAATPHTVTSLLRQLVVDGSHSRSVSLSAVVIVLSLLAPLLARKRHGVPYFSAVFVGFCILTLDETILHRLLYLVPKFETIHEHSARRVLWSGAFLAPAMLAGSTVQALARPRSRNVPWWLLLMPLGIIVAVGELIWLGWWVYAGASLTTTLVWLALRDRTSDQLPVPAMPARYVIAGLVVLTFLMPTGRDIVGSLIQPGGEYVHAPGWSSSDPIQNAIGTYVAPDDPGGAGEFLQGLRKNEPPFRFVGYAGRYYASGDTAPDRPYTGRRLTPAVLGVLGNGRAMRLELEHLQGYNPNHLRHYVDYIDAMNGFSQNYHFTDVHFLPLTGSPLLNMLNVRYIVVAADLATSRADGEAIAERWPEVFRNDTVVVYENTEALPRAWIVHEVRPGNDGQELSLLEDGSVDARQVAFVNDLSPQLIADLAEAEGTLANDSVSIVESSEDRVIALANSDTPGMVVFSEIYDEGWRAYVDGEPVDILRTNHAFRGVPIAPGEHRIEMRYEPTALRVGLWISGVTGIAMLVTGSLGIAAWARGRVPPVRSDGIPPVGPAVPAEPPKHRAVWLHALLLRGWPGAGNTSSLVDRRFNAKVPRQGEQDVSAPMAVRRRWRTPVGVASAFGWMRSDRIAATFGADIRALAAFRAVLALVVLIDLAGRAANLDVHYTDSGVLTRHLVIDDLHPWRWSLALANGTAFFQALLFLATAAAALAMLVGYRTRIATVVVWALVVSIQVRNPMLLSGADTLLRLLLFWAMLLPLGTWWSIDHQRRGRPGPHSMQYLSVASAGLFLQIAFMYWFTAILKSADEWRSSGTALQYAFGARHVTRDLGEFLFQFDGLLRMLTHVSLWLEFLAPVLLFFPIFTGPVRTFATFTIMAFQLGILLTFDIGIFPWTSTLCMVCFLPVWFWDRVVPQGRGAWQKLTGAARTSRLQAVIDRALSGAHRLHLRKYATGDSSPLRSDVPLRASTLLNLFAAFCLLFILGWNISGVSDYRMPARSDRVAYGLGIYQRWNMFAPRPTTATIWYVYPGRLADGTLVDVLPSIARGDLDRVQTLIWEEPADISSGLYGDKYWRKYLDAIASGATREERLAFAGYICRTWNAHYGGDAALESFEMVRMVRRTSLDGDHPEPNRNEFSQFRCS